MPIKTGSTLLLEGFRNYKQTGFNFRTEQVVAWNSLLGDILVANANGNGPPHFYMPGIAGEIATDTVADIVKAGIVERPAGSLAEIKDCPEQGYQHGWFKPRVDGLYCVVVRDGKSYAKIAVKQIGTDRIQFDWVYNPSGRPQF